jgi:hypothetical protein
VFVVAAVVLLAIGAAIYLAYGVRVGREACAEKLAILRTLEGEQVTLGIGTRWPVDRRGRLRAVDSKRATLVAHDGKERAFPLANIRWLEDGSGKVRGTW